MRYYSEKINVLVSQLKQLPGIGDKTAERLAYVIVKLDKKRIHALANAILDAGENVKLCKTCFATTDDEECPVCKSRNRNKNIIMVVERDDDLANIEHAGFYDGVYHVLQGSMNPAAGIGPKELHIPELIERLMGDVDEVIIATSFSVEGQLTATYLTRLLKDIGIKITRVASGIAIGSGLDGVDPETLKNAINGRNKA